MRILSQQIEPGDILKGSKVATVSVSHSRPSVVIVHTDDGNRHQYPIDYHVVVTNHA